MTLEEMCAAIGMACGYIAEVNTVDGEQFTHWFLYDKEGKCIDEGLPRYTQSLDAMFKADAIAQEFLMDGVQWEQYGKELEGMHPTACLMTFGSDGSSLDYYDAATLMTGLTAAQRAEAFCRTLWPEKFIKTVESEVCGHCEGAGSVSYNPNLNPNAFPATATARCPHCDGTGKAKP